MPINFPSDDGRTAEAMRDPQVGDRYNEMCTFWVYVIHVERDLVVTMEGNGPCRFPRDGKVQEQSRSEFKRRFSYRNAEGYWVRLVDRGNNVVGWYNAQETRT